MQSSWKNLGFRFFVSGMKNGLYGIKDLEDNSTEFYTYNKLIEVSMKIKIRGVENGFVNPNWFIGYIRREWAFKTSVYDFIKKFGLYFENMNGKLVLCICGIEDINSKYYSNFSFHEFVGSFVDRVYSIANDTVVSNLKYSRDDLYNSIRDILKGVGFNFLVSDVIPSIPVDILGNIDFDKIYTDSDLLKITLNTDMQLGALELDTRIHSLRPVEIVINGNLKCYLNKISSTGGKIICNLKCSAFYISEDFASASEFKLDSDSLSFKWIYVQSDFVLAKLAKNFLTTTSFSYCIGDNLCSGNHLCIVFGGLEKELTLDDNFSTFVVSDTNMSRIHLTRRVFNILKMEKYFERRHNITFEKFKERCIIDE